MGNGKATRKMIYDHLVIKITNRRISNIEFRSKKPELGNFDIRSSEFDIRYSLLIGAEVEAFHINVRCRFFDGNSPAIYRSL